MTTDHLLGGLAALALLLGAALAYPRLRPFSRGVTAFLVGLFGMAAGPSSPWGPRCSGSSS